MEVNAFIIHNLRKPQWEKTVPRYREECLEIDNAVIEFNNSAVGMFGKQKSGQIFAHFDATLKIFPQLLSRYIEREITFLEFSDTTAHLLVEKMDSIAASTGGYLIISDLVDQDNRLIMVLMLNQRGGYGINEETLTIGSLTHLDLDKIDVAAKIDINAYVAAQKDPLAIVAGKKQVSDYFQDFLGATGQITPEKSTKAITRFIDDWMADNPEQYPTDKILSVHSSVFEHIKEKHAAGEEADLRTIASLVAPEKPEEFFNKANAIGINPTFPVDPKSAKGWKIVEHKEKDLTIRFDRKLVFNHRIEYDVESNVLTINDVHPQLKAKILELRNEVKDVEQPDGNKNDTSAAD